VSFFEIYKRGQGKYTRISTFVGVVLVALVGAVFLSGRLVGLHPFIRFGVPAVLLVGIAVLMFWMVNRPKSADFLIATEGEMKKVSWSSRKEIIGSTKVVIITTLILAAILFGIDSIFVVLLRFLHS
jgi:preprotein translocase subunit SecE